ncbi:MAG TPA: septum formation initiator family protein [Caldisericia bacterium]|nr:septum formation initiator family protein [Caldisericia bacterium]HOL82948.1 septum formation initiator family protein [Caldisericia bacterium]HON83670.1 septum formation initiator family protein [Caldisericia bacterium]HPC56532.1 septum formation initiator family protein [Caldisericia bacterium]HPP42986.1 septum formation initiator family protein [Caldisericia bacterium]
MENKISRKRREIESLILILIFLLFLYTLIVPSIKLIKLYTDLKKIKNDIEITNNKIDKLEKNIEFYSSSEGLERWIKENFKLTKDNEKIYVFIEN